MKFSLKQLILFITIAAMLCGLTGYAYKRVEMVRHRANQAVREAEQASQESIQRAKLAEANFREAKAQLRLVSSPKPQAEFKYSILHWNVESGGNDPATIASQLMALGRYDIIGLSEVADPQPYIDAITQEHPDDYHFLRGRTGINNGREDDRLLLCVDNIKFDLIEFADMNEAGGVMFNNGGHCAPLYVRLKDRTTRQEVIVILNHLAGGDADVRQQQAGGLREWARARSTPIIAIGDFNSDYDILTKKGNAGFDAFLKDGIWKWVQPEELIDTNWLDDGNRSDRYPDSILDFSFVAGAAKDWKARCRVIVREGDFPDDEKTSDHRPVELILSDQ